MKQINRRQFVISAAALTAAPSALISGSALAAAQVDPDGPAAKALQYVHVSPNAETVCTNCKLYQGDTSADWGPCAIFPGQVVAGGGWCSAWVKV